CTSSSSSSIVSSSTDLSASSISSSASSSVLFSVSWVSSVSDSLSEDSSLLLQAAKITHSDSKSAHPRTFFLIIAISLLHKKLYIFHYKHYELKTTPIYNYKDDKSCLCIMIFSKIKIKT